jgi:hypothetical protein
MGGLPPDDGAGPGRGGAIDDGLGFGGGSGLGSFAGGGHDARPGTVAVGMVSAATSVLAVGALGAAARRRRRDGAAHAAAAAVAAQAAVIAAAPPAPLPIPPPPGPEVPPPWQTLTGRAPAKFAGGAGSNVERRTISYRFVRLSDGPDDLRSREIGRLDRGDEVEVLGEQDGMLQVRTPTGLLGWVPRVVIVG